MATETASPFDLPPVPQAKVHLGEVILLLRMHVNKFYMPSATGEIIYNRKINYVQARHPKHTDFPYFPSFVETGYYCILDHQPNADVFLHLAVPPVDLLVNLSSLRAIIRIQGAPEFVEWTDCPEQAIAIDRLALLDEIQHFT